MTNSENFPGASPRPLVKICGLRRFEDAALALELGAAFLGLILTSKSKRHLSLGDAESLLRSLRSERREPIRPIGVFVDEDPAFMEEALSRLGLLAVQVHGDSAPAREWLCAERVIPAIGVSTAEDASGLAELPAGHPAVLADAQSAGASGGTGKLFDHSLVQPLFARRRVFLAGGLSPENFSAVAKGLRGGPLPYAFDLSSGVEESPGVKSAAKLRAFFEAFNKAFPEGDAG